MNPKIVTAGQQAQALTASTLAFTVCFAVWTIFSIIGIQIKTELGLNDTQFGILVATPILTGSLSRLFLGVWADQYGGRLIFPFTRMVHVFSGITAPLKYLARSGYQIVRKR